MYEQTDKELKKLTTILVREFGKLKRKSILSFDNLNSLRKSVDDCYRKCYSAIVDSYTEIAKFYYKAGGGEETAITALMIEHFLSDNIDPVSKYIFKTETDRKRARTFEALAVSQNATKDADEALKAFHKQVKQFADNVTDEFTLRAYNDSGVKKVRWKTEEDSRVCRICGERNNEIYPIKKVPPKPHIGCRCYLLPV